MVAGGCLVLEASAMSLERGTWDTASAARLGVEVALQRVVEPAQGEPAPRPSTPRASPRRSTGGGPSAAGRAIATYGDRPARKTEQLVAERGTAPTSAAACPRERRNPRLGDEHTSAECVAARARGSCAASVTPFDDQSARASAAESAANSHSPFRVA